MSCTLVQTFIKKKKLALPINLLDIAETDGDGLGQVPAFDGVHLLNAFNRVHRGCNAIDGLRGNCHHPTTPQNRGSFTENLFKGYLRDVCMCEGQKLTELRR